MMPLRGLVQTMKGWLGKPIASPDSDPAIFFGRLFALPNPDPILREMGNGTAEKVYYSIMADAHVLGDVRSIRGNFRSHTWRLEVGDEGNSQSAAAMELCKDWMQRTAPNDLADWLEVMWQMASSFLTGYRAHELVWELMDGKYLPGQVIDRPNRRFRFDAYGAPLLISQTNMLGAPVEPYQFVISRHMPSSINPYGVPVLSSCFWPWTFKSGGWRYFVKYCERHGLPWPVGRYPIGTSEADQKQLEDALAGMMEAGYVVAQEGTGLELLTPTGGGASLPQQNLIDLCNREMSKATTGQAMVAELQGVGARAASETALKRQESIDDSVRDIAKQSMDSIFRWITLFNFGDGVAPPCIEFFMQEAAGKDRAETYDTARKAGARPSRKAMLDELGIPEAEDDADALMPDAPAAPAGTPPGGDAVSPVGRKPAGKPGTTAASTVTAGGVGSGGTGEQGQVMQLNGLAGFTVARAAGMTEDEAMQLAADAADQVIEDQMIAPIAQMLAEFEAQGKTLQEFKVALEDQVGKLDDEGLREVFDRALTYSMLRGAATMVG
jgi:phage gp29-like protein